MVDWEAFYREFREPDFVPGYRIEDRLGSGAFGEVYRARKTSIDKAYAIKFLRVDEEAAGPAVQRELEAVRHFAVIDHPNLVTIEDVGSTHGIPFLVMGYAGKETLAKLLKDGPLPADYARDLFVQVARGVHALHERDLAHFDLKPSNVFLRDGIARVGDYGLAKLLVDGRQTLSAGRGTPHYMAPEMLRGRADQRADQYSLGVILYETLTGALPFGERKGGGFALREVDEAPEFPGGYPEDLARVTTRLLRIDPEDRYGSVREVLGELGESAGSGAARLRLREDRPGGERGDDGDATRGVRASSDIVQVATLGSEEELPARESASSDSAWRRELARAREEDSTERGSGLLATPGAMPANLDESRSGTIPVPPAAEGGVVGNLLQSLVVGVEILGALLSAPLLLFGRSTARLVETVQGDVPGWTGRVLRFLLPVFLLAILGGLSAFLLLAIVAGTG